VHGLEGDIRHGGNVNSYYDDPHNATGQFDFVLANPPFNVNAVDKDRLKDMVDPGRRFPFGLPKPDNANYLWIQLFHSALNAKGRAGFVMANSASDARSSEQEIRQRLIEAQAVDVMVAVGPMACRFEVGRIALVDQLLLTREEPGPPTVPIGCTVEADKGYRRHVCPHTNST
jgi:type I restriction enzyme M protein